MDKLIILILLLTFAKCTLSDTNKNSKYQKMIDIGANEVQNYLKSLDSIEIANADIIEYRIEGHNQNYFFADMFISKPYLKGEVIPKYYKKVTLNNKTLHLLAYCDKFFLSHKDSLRTLSDLKTEDLVVNDLSEWTTYGKWVINDFEHFKFIFCKEDISNFTVNTRVQEVENNLEKPNCF